MKDGIDDSFPNSFQDEGDWRCTALAGKESVEGGEGEETCCGLVVYVPKSYRVPTFLGRVCSCRACGSHF